MLEQLSDDWCKRVDNGPGLAKFVVHGLYDVRLAERSFPLPERRILILDMEACMRAVWAKKVGVY